MPVERVIAANCHLLFPGHTVVDSFAFRVTRTAELAVEEAEADDLLQAIDSLLRFRQRTAGAIRLEVEEGSREATVELLRRELQLDPAEVYHRSALLDLGSLWSLYDLDRPDLKESPWTPTTSVRMRPAGEEKVRVFDVLGRGDVLVHYPYESFATSTGAFLAQAAKDPDVLAIKQTLYRTWASEDPAIGGEEAVVRSLMQAAEAGKQVVVLVELTARFDEAANLTWAKMLEDSGVHVVYGVVGLKTHSKILLVVRRERDGLRRYSHIGTGNYNPKTARMYEDIGIFTADPDVGRDLSDLFNALTGYGESSTYRKLLVAPTTLRRRITERIRQEGERGPEGRILFKLNHIDDPGIIDELYQASQQGCPIDLVVRGICSLRAGVPGLSPTIRVRSIVGRFLEHSRIYRFGHPDNGAVYYLGSADMMTRNLDKRVEALVPVTDPRLKARLEENVAGAAGGRRPRLDPLRRDLDQAAPGHRSRQPRRPAAARPRPPGRRERPLMATKPLAPVRAAGAVATSPGARAPSCSSSTGPSTATGPCPRATSTTTRATRRRRSASWPRRRVSAARWVPWWAASATGCGGGPRSCGTGWSTPRRRASAQLRGRRGGVGVAEEGDAAQLVRRRPVGHRHRDDAAGAAPFGVDPSAAPRRGGHPGRVGGRRREAPAVGPGPAAGRLVNNRLVQTTLTHILTSPYVRCEQSVVGLGRALDLPVEVEKPLTEEQPVEDTIELLTELEGTSAVLCTHGDIVSGVIGILAAEGVELDGDPEWKKGSVWELDLRKGRVRTGRYIPPPPVTAPESRFSARAGRRARRPPSPAPPRTGRRRRPSRRGGRTPTPTTPRGSGR